MLRYILYNIIDSLELYRKRTKLYIYKLELTGYCSKKLRVAINILNTYYF